MTQREKLIELILDGGIDADENGLEEYERYDRSCCIADFLLSNGVIVLPCKVGDKIYIFSRGKVKECEINYIGISVKEEYCILSFVEHYWDGSFMKSVSVSFDEIGKTVFLTREEAESKIRSMHE